MKVRIGVGLGTQGLAEPETTFAPMVDALERCRFDSLWLSERLTAPAPDPVVGLAFAAARTTKLKLGFSVLVLPGRSPVVLAKELATLDVLSNGRLLPAFGLGVADPREQQAFGVERGARAAWFDEALPLLRRLWTEDTVDHHGERFRYEGLQVLPKPLQQPPDVWLGGRAPSELQRVGRFGDGWLPSFCTPDEARDGRRVVGAAAAEIGRAIDPEHWGALIPYVRGEIPPRLASLVRARNPGANVADVIPTGPKELRDLLERFVDVGFSKFVVVPAFEPPSWVDEIEALAGEVLDLQR